VKTAPGFLAVSWTFPQGTLSMAVNIAATPQPLPDLPGETIFAWPDRGGDLPPHSILVRLLPGDAT